MNSSLLQPMWEILPAGWWLGHLCVRDVPAGASSQHKKPSHIFPQKVPTKEKNKFQGLAWRSRSFGPLTGSVLPTVFVGHIKTSVLTLSRLFPSLFAHSRCEWWFRNGLGASRHLALSGQKGSSSESEQEKKKKKSTSSQDPCRYVNDGSNDVISRVSISHLYDNEMMLVLVPSKDSNGMFQSGFEGLLRFETVIIPHWWHSSLICLPKKAFFLQRVLILACIVCIWR